jgi:DtxR family Mn-dependent transcriptional regulator
MDENKFYTVRGYQMQEKQALTPSLEDYLEMIFRTIQAAGYVRVNILAQQLNVKPSSVSKMLIKLAEQGYLDYEKYGVIRLTKKGIERGKYLLWRHNVINSFFQLLNTGEKAFEEAEQVEHILSEDTVKNIENLIKCFSEHKELREQWQDNLNSPK